MIVISSGLYFYEFSTNTICYRDDALYQVEKNKIGKGSGMSNLNIP